MFIGGGGKNPPLNSKDNSDINIIPDMFERKTFAHTAKSVHENKARLILLNRQSKHPIIF